MKNDFGLYNICLHMELGAFVKGIFTKKGRPVVKSEAVTPTETEAERLLRLKNQNLTDRTTNSRTRSGAGAFGPPGKTVASVPGEAPVVTNAREGALPVNDTTNLKGHPL